MEPFDYSRLAPVPYGFTNSGANCHFNSLIQALLSLPAFVELVRRNAASLDLIETGRIMGQIAREAPQTTGQVSSLSYDLLRALMVDLHSRQIINSFGTSQESASEGLTLLIDSLDTRRLTNVESAIAKAMYHRIICVYRCGRCKKEVSSRNDYAIILNLFYLDYLPHYPSTTEEFANCILRHVETVSDYTCENCSKVPIGDYLCDCVRCANAVQTLVLCNDPDCKKAVQGPRTTPLPSCCLCRKEGFSPCARSGKHVSPVQVRSCDECKKALERTCFNGCPDCKSGVRSYYLSLLPEILVCSFNVYHTRTHTPKPHWYPELLTFDGFRSGVKCKLQYKLVAQIDHSSGHLGGGHYTAVGTRGDQQTYCFNDTSVAPHSLRPNAHTYLIFYHFEKYV
jgi:hypothetical protein